MYRIKYCTLSCTQICIIYVNCTCRNIHGKCCKLRLKYEDNFCRIQDCYNISITLLCFYFNVGFIVSDPLIVPQSMLSK